MKHLKLFIFLCILTFTVSCGQQKRYIQYKVKKGETVSKIAEKLNMQPQDLLRLNPDINGEPRANSFLVVPEKKLNNFKNKIKNNPELIVVDSISGTGEIDEKAKFLEELNENFVIYEVKKGDTFYGLKKSFDLTRGELLVLNPELTDGLKVGMILKIKEIPATIISDEIFYSDYINFNKNLKVALLLPFITEKFKSDTLELKEIFANNSTLVNIATDFYLGAEIAIDSLRKKGVNIDLKSYDTGSRRGNGITNIISQNDLNSNDVIIGPLYSEEVTTIAANVNIPVVFPVYSKSQSGFSSSNIIKTAPDKKVFREELEKYITENFNVVDSIESISIDSIEDNNVVIENIAADVSSSNLVNSGNIIVVGDNDPKSMQTCRLMQSNLSFSTSGIVNILTPEEGYIEKTRFLEHLKPNSKNWVVLATDNNIIIENTINSLISLPEETTAKLFTFNKSRIYDRIDNNKLSKIGFTYVSDEYVDSSALHAKIFNKQYKKKNNTLPSFYATKGFDITYDILIRLASGNDLKSTLNEGMSRRIESKFDYRNSTYLSENKGLFIIQYNSDLTLTKLK